MGGTVVRTKNDSDTQPRSIQFSNLSAGSINSELYYNKESKKSFYDDYDNSKENKKEENDKEEKNEDYLNIQVSSSDQVKINFLKDFLKKDLDYLCSDCKEYFSYKFNNYENMNIECQVNANF